MKKLFIVISVLAAALLIPAPAKAAVGDSAKKVMCDWIKGRNLQVSEPVQTVCTSVGITLANVRPGTHQPTLEELAAIVEAKTQALATAQASYQDAADAYSAYMATLTDIPTAPCNAMYMPGPRQCQLGDGRDPSLDTTGHALELWDDVTAAWQNQLDAQAELDQAQQDYDDAAPPIITPPVTPPTLNPCISNPLLPQCNLK